MIISDYEWNKFTLRNRKDLSVIKTIEHDFGSLRCGICYSKNKVVILGIGWNLVEYDFEQMKFIKNAKTFAYVYHIEKVNDDTFLTCEMYGHIELIKKKDLTCLSHL